MSIFEQNSTMLMITVEGGYRLAGGECIYALVFVYNVGPDHYMYNCKFVTIHIDQDTHDIHLN